MDNRTETLLLFWAYSEQLHLFDNQDAFWIKCAKAEWKGCEEEFDQLLVAYGLKRGKIGKYLTNVKNRKELIKICNDKFTDKLAKDYVEDAQERWNKILKILSDRMQVTPASMTLKIFWFYHPEKLPMYDTYVQRALSQLNKPNKIIQANFLTYFFAYFSNMESKIKTVEKCFSRKYLSLPRVVDKYLWLRGSGEANDVLNKFETANKMIPCFPSVAEVKFQKKRGK